MKKYAVCSLIFILGLSLLLPSATGISAEASSRYDYTRAGDPRGSVVDQSDLLEGFLVASGGTMSAFERQYIAEHTSFELRYTNIVGISGIDAALSGNTLSLTARPYSYSAVNGEEVTFVPLRADGQAFAEQDGAYLLSRTVADTDGDYALVDYGADFPVDAQTADDVVNAAYRDAAAAYEKTSALQQQYEAELKAYQDYRAAKARYDAEKKAYDEYLAALRRYQTEKKAYDEYLADLAVYQAEKEEFLSYDARLKAYTERLKAYNEYVQAMATYEEKYRKFLDGLDSEEARTVLRQVSYLDAFYTAVEGEDGGKRSLYTAINGGTVAFVLREENKALIKKYAGDTLGKAVDRAEEATKFFRNEFFPAYQKAKTLDAKYGIYITLYEKIRDNTVKLLQTLDILFRNEMVKTAAAQKDRVPQFRLLLAQLYTVARLLQNGKIVNYEKAYGLYGGTRYDFDDSYRIDGYSPLSLLRGTAYPEDTDGAAPLENGVPALGEEPVKPAEVSPPGEAPKPPRDPGNPPPAVKDPGSPPAAVKEPVSPGKEPPLPEPYIPEGDEKLLSEGFASGEIVRRNAKDFLLRVTVSVRRYFRNVREVELYFYPYAGQEYVYSCTAQIGSALEDETAHALTVPEKTQTGYTCAFDGWQDEAGNYIDLSCVEVPEGVTSLKLYPHYRMTPLLYPLVWTVEGKRFETTCAYDASPVFDESAFGAPVRTVEAPRLSRFIGWRGTDGSVYSLGDKLPAMTEKGASYTARFEDSLVISWNIRGEYEREAVWAGTTPSHADPEPYTGSYYRYTFESWSPALKPADRDATYTAQYAFEPLVSAGNVSAAVACEEDAYVADCTLAEPENISFATLFSLAAQEGREVRFRFSGMELAFSVAAAEEYLSVGADAFTLSLLATGEYSYRWTFSVFSNGEKVYPAESCRIYSSGAFDAAHSYLYCTMDDGTMSEVRFTVEDDVLRFTVQAGGEYSLDRRFLVNTVASDDVEFETSAAFSKAKEGDTISLRIVRYAPGMKFGRVSVVDEAGNEIAVRGLTFRMPASSVTVQIVAAYIDYTVTFRSDGKTLSVRTYRYGDLPEPPFDPVKPSDDEYSYVFEGWDGISPVTEDAVYNAHFRAVPLPPPPDTDAAKALVRTINAVIITVPVLLCLALFAVILLIVLRKNSRKRAQAQAAPAEAEKSAPYEKNSPAPLQKAPAKTKKAPAQKAPAPEAAAQITPQTAEPPAEEGEGSAPAEEGERSAPAEEGTFESPGISEGPAFESPGISEGPASDGSAEGESGGEISQDVPADPASGETSDG